MEFTEKKKILHKHIKGFGSRPHQTTESVKMQNLDRQEIMAVWAYLQ